MRPRFLIFLLLTMIGCALNQVSPGDYGSLPVPQPAIPRLQSEVQPDIDRYARAQQANASNALAEAQLFPGSCKRPIALEAFASPWRGMANLEWQGLRIAQVARPHQLPADPPRMTALASVIAAIEAGIGRTPSAHTPLRIPEGNSVEEQRLYLLGVLAQANELREKALRNVHPEDRRFLFEHASVIVNGFRPQISELNEQTIADAKKDRQFCKLAAERLDYAALIAAAQTLAELADDVWQQQFAAIFKHQKAMSAQPPGVTGSVLMVWESPYGLIIIGGPGPNTYDLDGRIALLIDTGGDDHYRGVIAASADAEHGISVVIDLAGNDTYDASPLGLATGRLGVGLLIDRADNDLYRLTEGSGGAGFAGLGILYDMAGNDRYHGEKFTQGAAVAGLGLLLDGRDNDSYTSFGYGLGFGGPLGVGALIDVAGRDHYACGETYASNYNDSDLPGGKPGDPKFQYDAFCMGTGSGKRIFTTDPGLLSYGLAGGLGIFIDVEGNDHYRSSNFSQGCGYFFGVGLKLDLAGNDEHAAARYGLAAGAHFGIGLFIDYVGDDDYSSTGPFYNGATAWDRSVALFIDAGPGDDRYDLLQSDGLGRADYGSWSVFIEEAGRDRYLVPNGMGNATNAAMSAFFDLAGEDDYAKVPRTARDIRANGRTILEQAGGLFVDR